jgi:hypothetical protein
MKRFAATVVLLVGTLVAWPNVAAAQDRDGLWGGIGAGWGSATVTSDETGDADNDRESSGVLYINVGGTLNEHLLLGVEFDMWSKTVPLETNLDGKLKMYNLDATLTVYPSARAGFFLKGGVGLSLLNLELVGPASSLKLDMGNGLGLIAGMGYDIPLGGSVSLTPGLNYWRGNLGDLHVADQTSFSNWKQNVFDVTLGLTFH